jgi:hypothetical protein
VKAGDQLQPVLSVFAHHDRDEHVFRSIDELGVTVTLAA